MNPPERGHSLTSLSYLTESVYKIVLRKSSPLQIRQFILYISNDTGQVNRFVLELTFVKRLDENFL